MGYGRAKRDYSLEDTLNERETYGIMWRKFQQLLTNGSIATPTTSEAPHPIPAFAPPGGVLDPDWRDPQGDRRLNSHPFHAMVSQMTNESLAAQRAEQLELKYYRSTMRDIKTSAELMSDAAALARVPGSAPLLFSTKFLSFAASIAGIIIKEEKGKKYGWSKISLDHGASIEVEYPVEEFPLQTGDSKKISYLIGNGTNPLPTQFFAPMAGVIWRERGDSDITGVYTWMDTTRIVVSDVVQYRRFLNLYEGQKPFSLVRYRFIVPRPLAPSNCAQNAPNRILKLCCPNLVLSDSAPAPAASCDPNAFTTTTTTTSTMTTTSRSTTTMTTTLTPPGAYAVMTEGSDLPFDGPLLKLVPGMQAWTPETVQMRVAGTKIRIRGGDLRIGRICVNSGLANVTVLEGKVLEGVTNPDDPTELIEDIGDENRTSHPKLAEDVIMPKEVNATTSTSTTTTNNFFCQGIWTEARRLKARNTTVLGKYFKLTSYLLQAANTSVPEGWVRPTDAVANIADCKSKAASSGDSSKYVWCPTALADDYAPTYADILIEAPAGAEVLIMNMTGVQISFDGSADLNIGAISENDRLILGMNRVEYKFIELLRRMYHNSFKTLTVLTELSNMSMIQRPWSHLTTTTTTTTTTTITTLTTTTKPTTTTTTTTRADDEIPESPPGLALTFVENAMESYLDFLTETLSTSAATKSLEGLSFEAKLDLAAQAVDAWSVTAASAIDLPTIYSGLVGAATLVDLSDTRSLDEILFELDAAVPAYWNESFWQGKNEFDLSSLKVISATTTTTTTTMDAATYATFCSEVSSCEIPEDCAFRPDETLECVAWSNAMLRWVPAMACKIELGLPMNSRTIAEVVCVCEKGSAHPAVAVAVREDPLTPRPPRQVITTKEYLVDWKTKVNRYNVRGFDLSKLLGALGLLHLTLACILEFKFRVRSRHAHRRSDADHEVQMQVDALEKKEKDFKADKIKQINAVTDAKAGIGDLREKLHAGARLPKATVEESEAPQLAPEGGILIRYVSGLPHAKKRGLSPTTMNNLVHLPRRPLLDADADADDSRPPSGACTPPRNTPRANQPGNAKLEPIPSSPGSTRNIPDSPSSARPGMLKKMSRSMSGMLGKKKSGVIDISLRASDDDMPETDGNGYWDKTNIDRAEKKSGAEHEHLRRINDLMASHSFLKPGAYKKIEPEGQDITMKVSNAWNEDPTAKAMGEDTTKQQISVAKQITEVLAHKAPERPKKPSCWRLFKNALARCHYKNLWYHCTLHHKLFSMHLDSQTWLFSAPERVCVFHVTLWINAICLASLLHRWSFSRPGEDTRCEQTGLITKYCIIHRPSIEAAAWSAFFTLIFSNILHIVCRGRSFKVRAKNMTREDSERAYVKHVLSPWPVCLCAPWEVVSWLCNCIVAPFRYLTCRPPREPRSPLAWRPSYVPIVVIVLGGIGAWTLTYCCFHYSSSSFLWDITYSDKSGFKETVRPIHERAEETAAKDNDSDNWHWLLVPHMQRYIILLVTSWIAHLFVYEPLAFLFHLFINDPGIEDAISFGIAVVRFIFWLLQRPFVFIAFVLEPCYMPCVRYAREQRERKAFRPIAQAPPPLEEPDWREFPLQIAEEVWLR